MVVHYHSQDKNGLADTILDAGSPLNRQINTYMKIRDIIGEAAGVGLVVPGVNMPAGMHQDEIRRQARKFKFDVDKNGRPPVAKTNGSDVFAKK